MKLRANTMIPALAVLACVATASPFAFFGPQALKVTVDGDGYLRFSHDGRAVYAKSVKLSVSADGKLATSEGDLVLPTINAPTDTQKLLIDLDGTVYSIRGAGKAKLGRLVLALFPDGTALSEKDGLLYATDRPKLGNPGDDTNGVIRCELSSIQTKNSAPDQIQRTETPQTIPQESAPKTIPVDPPTQKAAVPKTDPSKNGGTLPAVVPDNTTPKTQTNTPTQQAPATGKWSVIANGKAEVENDQILLGEVAQITADPTVKQAIEQIELGDSPTLGARHSIDRMRIVAKIKAAGFNVNDFDIIVPGTIEVTRKGQSITQEEFNQAAVKAILESPGLVTEYLPADAKGPDFLAPAGKYALVVEAISGVNTPVVTAKVAVYVGIKRINSRTLKFNAKALPVAVKIGASVKVLFRAGGAVVETSGVARTAGRVGEPISVDVRLPGSDKTNHSGLLMADGSVEVKL